MENSELIYKILDKLEMLVLDLSHEIGAVKEKNKEYELVSGLLDTINNSKIDFVVTYFNVSEDNRTNINNLIYKLYSSKGEADEVINEIVNLFQLYSNGLHELKELEPQVAKSFEILDDFAGKLDQYKGEIEYSQEDISKKQELMEKLISFGVIFGNGTQGTIIDDIDSLYEILDVLDISDDEKVTLIESIIRENVRFYEEKISVHNRKIRKEIETSKQEVEEEIIEEEQIHTISPELLEEIDEILKKPRVIEKIVRIINNDYKMLIRVDGRSYDEHDEIVETLSLARDDLSEKVMTEGISPYEALEKFYIENAQPQEDKIYLLYDILDDSDEADIPYEEQVSIIKKASDFLNKNHSLLQNLPRSEREILSQYMVSIYKSRDHRMMLYKSRSYDDIDKIIVEATYEIKVLLNLFNSIDKDSEEYMDLLKKVSKRLKDIFDCIDELSKDKDTGPDTVEDESGNLFYLMRNDNKSMLEDDVKPDDNSKGISTDYYEELEFILDAIKNRETSQIQVSTPTGEHYKNLRKCGALVTTTSRVQVLFIPVGKKDAIILGVVFSYGKQFTLKDQDMRARKYMKNILELKNKLSKEDEYNSELETANITDKRIRASLDNGMTDSSDVEELADMLDEDNKNQGSGNNSKK